MTQLTILSAAAISPLGGDLDRIWANLLAGATAYGKVSLPGSRSYFAAESVPGAASDCAAYAPLFYDAIRDLVRGLAVEEPVDAIYFATAVGNLADVEHKIYAQAGVRLADLDFSALRAVFEDTPACGPQTRFVCVPTGCCAGLQAIGLAKKTMEKLGLERAIVMSLDFGLTPLAFAAFDKINATRAFDPTLNATPSRPFCTAREGFLFADGGGAVLVTTRPPQHGEPRVTGYGCVSSAYHMTDIAVDGASIRESIVRALVDGRAIDHVNLHASGTKQNDEAEHSALLDVIGADLPPITAFKGNHGHALGGANLIEVALVWKLLRENLVPPTPASLPVDAFDDVPPRAAPTPFLGDVVLKTASGFSGIHASIIMER